MNITRPTLLVNQKLVKQNIEKMVQKAKLSGAVFRPHFKTHQSEQVAGFFWDAGVRQITVSSVSMAKTFARQGWRDITIAFPFNLRELADVQALSVKININVLAESVFVVKELSKNLAADTGVFIKIDTGYHRTGVAPDDFLALDAMLSALEEAPHLHFKGFLTHAGHTYHARGKEQILEIMQSALQQMTRLKEKYSARFPGLVLSYGDTPSCSVATRCDGFDEIRPGNFVYYDVMQYHLGSCRTEEIAVAVASPVVALHPDREEMVVYGGAVHLSTEFIAADNGFRLYGYVVRLDDRNHWREPIPGAYVSRLSQEHGVVKMPQKVLATFRPGDFVGILPVHSCLTADLLRGDTVFV